MTKSVPETKFLTYFMRWVIGFEISRDVSEWCRVQEFIR